MWLKSVILGDNGKISVPEKVSVPEPPLPEIKVPEKPVKEDIPSVPQSVVGIQNLKDSGSALISDKIVGGETD